MASILDRYGIKEVADVTFYEIGSDGKAGKPVLFLDTLKVSTIEQTAETADARGGKGNPKLITWDYGKEINVTIEDALFSPKSMSIMLGNGLVTTTTSTWIDRMATVRATSTSLPDYFIGDIYDWNKEDNNKPNEAGSVRTRIYMDTTGTIMPSGAGYYDLDASASRIKLIGVFNEDGSELKATVGESGSVSITTESAWAAAVATAGNKYFVKYQVAARQKSITISGDSFPGTYYIQGDTYARSDVTGKDQFFQFIIPKAKMTAEQTITLEAEGDPSTFNMNLTVLRPEDGNMMILNQYDLINAGPSGSAG